MHADPLRQQFFGLRIVDARPGFGDLAFAPARLADDLQHLPNRHVLAIFHFQFSGEHEAWIGRVAAHMGPSANLVDNGGHDPAVQHAGVALKMVWRDVLRFDHAGLGFIDVQVQANRVFHPANEAMSRIWLFYFWHNPDYTRRMSSPRVFVTRPIPDAGMNFLKEAFPDSERLEVWLQDVPPTREQLLQYVVGAEGLLCLLTERVDAELLDAVGPSLKVVSSMSVGVDHIDLVEATRRGIPVGHTPGVLTDATADQAFALLLSAARRIPEAERFVRTGKWVTWSPSLLLGADLVGRTLGIVGFGRIGQAVAKRAQGFDMRVIYHDRSSEPAYGARSVDLDTLLNESDFISMHVPLTQSTRHMVDADFLSRMKPGAVLVNTSRGGVVDQDALYVALKSKRIFAAALDVTDPEPLPADSPLLELENCIVVPHLGSASKWTRDQMSLLAAQNLVAGLKGDRLPYCANPGVYSTE